MKIYKIIVYDKEYVYPIYKKFIKHDLLQCKYVEDLYIIFRWNYVVRNIKYYLLE